MWSTTVDHNNMLLLTLLLCDFGFRPSRRAQCQQSRRAHCQQSRRAQCQQSRRAQCQPSRRAQYISASPADISKKRTLEERHTWEVLAEREEDAMRNDEFGLQPEKIDGIIMDNARICPIFCPTEKSISGPERQYRTLSHAKRHPLGQHH